MTFAAIVIIGSVVLWLTRQFESNW